MQTGVGGTSEADDTSMASRCGSDQIPGVDGGGGLVPGAEGGGGLRVGVDGAALGPQRGVLVPGAEGGGGLRVGVDGAALGPQQLSVLARLSGVLGRIVAAVWR